jgi:hypothetical protein
VAWLSARASVASRVIAVEDALLSGRFARYAGRRLFAFALARGWATALHVVELTWLAHVFSAKPFVASLALQNASLVAEALYWGALEPMRRRARELGESSESAALVTRWLTVAFWCAIAVVLIPIARAAWVWNETRHTPTLLDVYAFVCALRFGADVVLRTYYSGVFAFRRVHRPVWSVFVGPTILAAVTMALWNAIAGWSFAVALLVSVVVTRALLFGFTRRAYRMHRVPSPRLRLRPRRKPPRSITNWRARAEIAVAALANTATRLGSVVLLAAVVPSLTTIENDEGEPTIEPFALALHVAAPLLLVSAQWGLSFYHDWKRLEDDEAEILAGHLYRRTIVTALLVAVVAWALTVVVVRMYVPIDDVKTVLAALLVGMIGLAVWSAINLRGFARGEFVRQLAASLAMIAVLWVALSATFAGEPLWYFALGAGPWVAIVLHELLGLWRWRRATGIVTTHAAWSHALRASRGKTIVWEAKAARAPARIAERIAKELGERGALVRVRTRLLWFERVERSDRLEWLRIGGGELVDLRMLDAASASSHPNGDVEAERAAFMKAHPDGFVVEIGRRPPAPFLALEPAERQAIWREAVRNARAGRGRTRWRVVACAPRGGAGGIEAFFVAPRRSPNSRTAVKADIFET